MEHPRGGVAAPGMGTGRRRDSRVSRLEGDVGDSDIPISLSHPTGNCCYAQNTGTVLQRMLMVVPRMERSARGTASSPVSSSCRTENGTVTATPGSHRVPSRGDEPPAPHFPGCRGWAVLSPVRLHPHRSGVGSTHLPALEGLGDSVQPREVVLVHAGDVAGAVTPGPVGDQQLFGDRAGSAQRGPVPAAPVPGSPRTLP